MRIIIGIAIGLMFGAGFVAAREVYKNPLYVTDTLSPENARWTLSKVYDENFGSVCYVLNTGWGTGGGIAISCLKETPAPIQ